MGNLVSGFTVSLSLPVCHAAILSAARGPSAPSVRNPHSVGEAIQRDQLGRRDHCPRNWILGGKEKGVEIGHFKADTLVGSEYRRVCWRALSLAYISSLCTRLTNANRNAS